MEAVEKMKNTVKPLTYLTFKGSVTRKENTTELPEDNDARNLCGNTWGIPLVLSNIVS
jgi:hypothetical protein